MALRLLFVNGITMVVEREATEVTSPSLNDNKVVVKVDQIPETLSSVIACFHRVKRGRILGIRSDAYKNGIVVNVCEISTLPAEEVKYCAWELVQEHEEATTEQLLGILDGLQAQVSVARPLSQEVIVGILNKMKYHIVWSNNAIEGSTYSLGETILAITRGIAASFKPGEDLSRAVDGGRAVEYVRQVFTSSSALIMTEDELKQLHTLLMKHSFDEEILHGKYRRYEIRVTGSSFQFPPYTEVPDLMTGFMMWLNAKERKFEHPVAFAVEAHLRFVTIHPFEDGNGRTSRLLMNLVLMKTGFTPVWIPPSCRPEYLARVKDYQIRSVHSDQLLELVANEVMRALNDILDDASGAHTG